MLKQIVLSGGAGTQSITVPEGKYWIVTSIHYVDFESPDDLTVQKSAQQSTYVFGHPTGDPTGEDISSLGGTTFRLTSQSYDWNGNFYLPYGQGTNEFRIIDEAPEIEVASITYFEFDNE